MRLCPDLKLESRRDCSLCFSNQWTALSWSPATDAESGADLSCHLRVGTTAGGFGIVSPESLPSGRRRIPAMGNMQLRTRALLALTNGTYHWSVQAADGGLCGGPFADEPAFTVGSSPRLSITPFGAKVILELATRQTRFVREATTCRKRDTPEAGRAMKIRISHGVDERMLTTPAWRVLWPL